MVVNEMNNGEDPTTAESSQQSDSDPLATPEEESSLPAPRGMVLASPDLARLNISNSTSMALVYLPNSGKVEVIYVLGFRYSSIGKTVATNCKLLALTDEGGGKLSSPHPL
eukprot:7338126-Ditylum_brightwellii.AAC.1